MKYQYQVDDPYQISWVRNYEDNEGIREEMRMILDAGKWEEFLSLHADENGVVDMDEVYDCLRYEGPGSLLSVGLHYTESTHTVKEVLEAWEKENAPLKVSRLENGKPSGLMLFNYGRSGIALDFESVDENGEVESESLDADEVFDLVGDNNSTEGEWTGTDCESDVFECWRGN